MIGRVMRFALVVGLVGVLPVPAGALPFNDDMVNVQKRTGTIMRQKPAGTVAVGSLNGQVQTRDEAVALTNPVKADEASVNRGRALFSMNCYPCHGDLEHQPGGADYVGGPVSQKMQVGGQSYRAPDIRNPLYRDSRTDGDIYSVIHFGSPSGLMQPMGWKFSPNEHWDLINFVRSAQKQGK